MPLDLRAAVRAGQQADPASLPDIVRSAAGGFGATDVVLYLVDFAQYSLTPVPDRRAHADAPEVEKVGSSMAGRAFTGLSVVTAERPDGVRVWVPVVEGSDRTGVLALTVADATDAILAACEELGLFTGYLLATLARSTDLYNLYRRRRSMSLAASMQWDLLPPLTLKSDALIVAGLLEPAYEIGGDSFDYALNDVFFDLAVIDAAGHGVGSALISALALGSYRHDRREARSLEQIHANLDAAITEHLPPMAFATGQLCRIDVGSGNMTWTNAGHPLPLLVRGGSVVHELSCAPTPPWGVGSLARTTTPTVATESLEPGDAVLFYTDGVVEAHEPGGDIFGVDRLIDLVSQHSSQEIEPEEIVRRIVRSVLDHQGDQLADDATLVMLQWNGSAET